MGLSSLTEINWPRLSDIIAETMGLHFPSDRWPDLQRGLACAAEEFGFGDVAACVDWLLAAPLNKAQLHVLSSHLTVGETYFFRERRTFDAIAESILPELIRSRRHREQRLRIWSAACCTGEEPYSLAILLHQLIPDLSDWRVVILATDINERFLQKATAGSYGEWSFRGTPAWLKERYFQRTEDGRHAILPKIKKLVTFTHLNLVEDTYPSLATDTNAMDVIFCRNVLMYFTLPQAQKVLKKLHHALVPDGWLVVNASEGSQATAARFVPVNFPEAILHQKSDMPERAERPWAPAPIGEGTECLDPAPELILRWMPQPLTAPPLIVPTASPTAEWAAVKLPLPPHAVAAALYQQGRYAEAADTLLASFAEAVAPDSQALSLLARALANQGKLTDARAWCDRWVAADKLDSSGHYLRAVISQELGDHEQARLSLQRTIYLQPGFVLAHFALGNLARSAGKAGAADKHLTNALSLLRGCPSDEFLPESDGLTTGRLTAIITSLIALGATS